MSPAPASEVAGESRGRAHSITMSSGPPSRASSLGPSSFTENLTLYMNGSREPVFPPAQPTTTQPNTSTQPAAKKASEVPSTKAKSPAVADMEDDDDRDAQDLRDELEAALKRHDELMAENRRLREDLEGSTARALLVGPLEKELREAREIVAESEPRVEAARRQLEVERLRAEELEREAKEMREKITKGDEERRETWEEIKKAREEAEKAREEARRARDADSQRDDTIDALQRERERREERPEDELDAQSWIDELEDDLERTRHELDKAIKDRQRVERQLDFTRADYETEKQLVIDLRSKLEASRNVEKSLTSRSPLSTPKKISSSQSNDLSSDESDGLKPALERAAANIATLEKQLKDARSSIEQHSADLIASAQQTEELAKMHAEHQANADRQLQKQTELVANLKDTLQARERAASRSPVRRKRDVSTGSVDESAMDRAEAYIRKLKAQEAELKESLREAKSREAELKQDLRESRAQESQLKQDLRDLRALAPEIKLELRDARSVRDGLKGRLASVEDALQDSRAEVARLNGQVAELQATKERMGRVLMYQWGKEEVGEIERRRGDGKRERGMGYKYKYYNKDGSLKDN